MKRLNKATDKQLIATAITDLKQIKDTNKRKDIFLQMMKDFEKIGVKYDEKDFKKRASVFQKGGKNKSLFGSLQDYAADNIMSNRAEEELKDLEAPGNNKQSFLNIGAGTSPEFPDEREILLTKGLKYKLENITPEDVREFSMVNPYSLGLLAATGVGVSQMKRGNRLKFKNGGSIKPSNIDSNRLKLKSNIKSIKDMKVSHNRYLKASLQF